MLVKPQKNLSAWGQVACTKIAQKLHKIAQELLKIAQKLHKPFDQALGASTVHYALHVVAIYIICNSEFMGLFQFE